MMDRSKRSTEAPSSAGLTCSGTCAVILAGGLGTRLRSAVGDRPKVIAEVDGSPFLAFLLHQLASEGFTRVVLCTGYRSEDVRATFGERAFGLDIRYSVEEEPLGTGGAIRQALSLVDSDPFLALNGDSYCDTSLSAFLGAWSGQDRAQPSGGVLFLAHVPDIARFGGVELDALGNIIKFTEKGGTGSGLINAGIYLLSQSLFAGISPGRMISLERELFPVWVERSALRGYRGTVSRFIDIGTPESYREAQELLRGAIAESPQNGGAERRQ